MTTNPFVTLDLDTLSTLKPLRRVVYSLGGNVGDVPETLQQAVRHLARTPNLIVTGVSRVFSTEPWGGVAQPDFLNIVLLAESTMPSTVLLERALAVEDALGRVRGEHWGPRTIDIDLIRVGARVRNDPHLVLPHPHAHERAFVLVPWLDVEPSAELPGHGYVADLVAGLDTSGVRLVPDVRIDLP